MVVVVVTGLHGRSCGNDGGNPAGVTVRTILVTLTAVVAMAAVVTTAVMILLMGGTVDYITVTI